jgi:predicted HAD superfamily Cof-like phosphohydrolase
MSQFKNIQLKITQLKQLLIDNQQYEAAARSRDIEKDIIDIFQYMENTKIVDYNTVKKAMQSVPFVDEVEVFNRTMGKPNNYTPNIPDEKEWMFVYNFILEELEEYKEACQQGDIVGVLDALCDITYVSLGNGTMLHGLKGQIKDAYAEVQASNMSKVCKTEVEAQQTVNRRTIEQGMECHYEKQGDYWVVYRTSDRKVMKSINYFKPNLEQFFK